MKKLILLILVALSIGVSAEHDFPPEAFYEVKFHYSFADDYGDMLDKIVYKDKEYNVSEASEAILPRIGWKSKQQRLGLGTAWVRELAFLGFEVLDQPKNHVTADKFTPPKSELLPDGTFRFTAWAILVAGRNPGSSLVHRQVEITPQAEMVSKDLFVRSYGPYFTP